MTRRHQRVFLHLDDATRHFSKRPAPCAADVAEGKRRAPRTRCERAVASPQRFSSLGWTAGWSSPELAQKLDF